MSARRSAPLAQQARSGLPARPQPLKRTDLSFPKDFRWGCATAAYQIEGAVQGGRARTDQLGRLLPHARQDLQRRHRRRRRRQLPPLRRGHAAAQEPRRQHLSHVARLVAHLPRRARGSPIPRASIITSASSTICSRTASSPMSPCSTGTCRRRFPAAGRTATRPTPSPITRATWPASSPTASRTS